MQQEENYKVYMHVNKINDKKYIGITCLSLSQRSGKNGNNYKDCIHFWHAIQKYGWDNFDHIIIMDNLTREQACKKEIELIQELSTKYPDKCYNILPGGDLGRKGIIITEEYRDKFRGKNNPAAKSVICIETNRVFGTLTDAANYYGVDRSNIGRSCRIGVACGEVEGIKLHWAFYDNVNNTFDAVEIRTNNKPAYCITTGKYFQSLKDASEYYDIPYDSVWYSCKHHGDVACYYRFKYADEIQENGKDILSGDLCA